jgi:hypothetical protein
VKTQKTFPSDRANQPFRMSNLPWRLGRGWSVTNAHSAKPLGEKFAVDPVAIADDVPRWAFPAAGFGELPGAAQVTVPFARLAAGSAERRKLVEVAARAISDLHDLGRQVQRLLDDGDERCRATLTLRSSMIPSMTPVFTWISCSSGARCFPI